MDGWSLHSVPRLKLLSTIHRSKLSRPLTNFSSFPKTKLLICRKGWHMSNNMMSDSHVEDDGQEGRTSIHHLTHDIRIQAEHHHPQSWTNRTIERDFSLQNEQVTRIKIQSIITWWPESSMHQPPSQPRANLFNNLQVCMYTYTCKWLVDAATWQSSLSKSASSLDWIQPIKYDGIMGIYNNKRPSPVFQGCTDYGTLKGIDE